jgi:hypothetical protein
MQDQPRYKPLAVSDFFADHRSARPMVEGTVARGHLRIDEARYVGKINGEDIDQFPSPSPRPISSAARIASTSTARLATAADGDGNGMVVLRGFRQPPSYYTDRLVQRAGGTFLRRDHQRIRAMPSYASRVSRMTAGALSPISALQLSETATLNDVPADQRQNLPVEPPPRGLNQGPQPGNSDCRRAAGPPGARNQ